MPADPVPLPPAVARRVAALTGMTAARLRREYAAVFSEPKSSGNKGWLVRRLAWRIQADATAAALAPVARAATDTLAAGTTLHFDHLLGSGGVASRAELARLGGVTRARVTQVLALLRLAPDLQEAVLTLPRVTAGRDPVTLRHLLPVAAASNWDDQRAAWRAVAAPSR